MEGYGVVGSGYEGAQVPNGKGTRLSDCNKNRRKIVCVRVCVHISKNLCSVYVLAPPIKNTDVKQSLGKDLVWDGDGLVFFFFFFTLSL